MFSSKKRAKSKPLKSGGINMAENKKVFCRNCNKEIEPEKETGQIPNACPFCHETLTKQQRKNAAFWFWAGLGCAVFTVVFFILFVLLIGMLIPKERPDAEIKNAPPAAAEISLTAVEVSEQVIPERPAPATTSKAGENGKSGEAEKSSSKTSSATTEKRHSSESQTPDSAKKNEPKQANAHQPGMENAVPASSEQPGKQAESKPVSQYNNLFLMLKTLEAGFDPLNPGCKELLNKITRTWE